MVDSPTLVFDFLNTLRLPEEKGFQEFRSFEPVSRKPIQGWQQWPPKDEFDKQYFFDPGLEHYFGILLRQHREGNARNVVAGSVAWIDFDLAESRYLPANKIEILKWGIPALREAAAGMWLDLYNECDTLSMIPLLAVTSGQGLHVYWGLSETRKGEMLESINKGLIKLFAGYNAEQGTHDRARILRIPGTQHLKNPTRPLPVEIMYSGGPRHHPEILEMYRQIEEAKPLPRPIEEAMRKGLTPWAPSDYDLRKIIESWDAGERNQKSMAFGGWCAAHGVPEHVALTLIERICREAGDSETKNRVDAVGRSYRRYFAGQPTLGFSTLERMVGGLSGRGTIQLGVLTPGASDRVMADEGGPGLVLPSDYRLGEDGSLILVKIKTTKHGVVEEYETLARRWLELRGISTDMATGESHLTLAWPASGGEIVEATLPYGEAMTRQGLLELASRRAPVDELNASGLTRYLQAAYALNRETLQEERVTSHLGWHGPEFLLPGGGTQVLGVSAEGWEPAGELAAWLEGLEALLSWGITPALIGVALSATAPFVRGLRLSKNPILAFSTTSHTGKTTAARFALSIWGNPEYNETLYFDNATLNGLMGRLMTRQDLPVGLDDHQRYEDRQVNELLHLLAGGAEKARSRRDGGERLARRWRGAALLTGETSALREALGTGAVNRIVELDDYPLGIARGKEGLERSDILRRASQHYGVARNKVLELMQPDLHEHVLSYAGIASEGGVPGDLSQMVGLLAMGIDRLSQWVGAESPVDAVVGYMASKIQAQRDSHGSLAGRAMAALRSLLVSYRSSEGTDELMDGKSLLAFERNGVWYVEPTAKEVERVLKPYGALDNHLAEWAREGWIEVETEAGKRRHTVKKSWKGSYGRYVGILPNEKDE